MSPAVVARVAALTCCLAAACTSATDDTVGGVPASTSLASLGGGDKNAVCSAFVDAQTRIAATPEFVDGLCLERAIIQSQNEPDATRESVCNTRWQACIVEVQGMGGAEVIVSRSQLSACNDPTSPSCNVPVGVILDCLAAGARRTTTLAAQLSCANTITDVNAVPLPESMGEPCVDILAPCGSTLQ